MNRNVITIILLFFFLSVTACISKEGLQAGEPVITTISTEEAALLAESKDDSGLVIIDIRTPPEYEGGIIEGAINIDYYAPDFRDEIDALDRNGTYLIYCRTGNRSGRSKALFAGLGFSEVYDMGGGIVKWAREERPVVEP